MRVLTWVGGLWLVLVGFGWLIDLKDTIYHQSAINSPVPIHPNHQGIWHPIAPRVFEDSAEYMQWYNTEHAPAAGVDPAKCPTIGVILQKSHINTKVRPCLCALGQVCEG